MHDPHLIDFEPLLTASTKLSESQQLDLYRRLARIVGDVLYVYDGPLKRYVYWDESVEDLVGVPASELTEPIWTNMVQEVRMRGQCFRMGPREAYDLAVAGKVEVWDAEYRILTPKGETKWARDFAAAVRDEFGEMRGWLGVLRDITDRKRADVQIRLSADRTRSLLESSPLGIHMFRQDSEGRLIFIGANPAADRVLGMDHRELIGLTLEEAFPGNVGSELPAAFAKVAKEGGTWDRETYGYEHEDIAGVFEVHAFQTEPGSVAVFFQDIGERTRDRRALLESERRYRSLVESLSEGVFQADTNGRVKYLNAAMARLLGLKPSEVAGRRIGEFVHREDRKAALSALRSQERHTAEVRLRGRNGEHRWIRVTIGRVDEDGLGPSMHGLVTDIDQTRKALEALRAGEERFRAIVESSTERFHVLTETGEFQYSSPARLSPLRFRPEELLGRNWADITVPEDLPLQRRAMALALEKKGEAVPVLLRTPLRDGSIAHIQCTVSNMLETPGIRGLLMTAHDVTQKVLAEERIRQSERQFRLLAEHLPGVVYICKHDEDLTTTYMNASIEELTGFDASEFLDRRVAYRSLIHKLDAPIVRGRIDQALLENRPYHLVYRVRHRSGLWRWVEEWGSAFGHEGETATLEGFIHDITDRRRIEEERARQLRRLETLRTIDLEITTSGDLERTLRVVVERALRDFEADTVLIGLSEGDELGLVVAAGYGSALEETEQNSCIASLLAKTLVEGRTQMSCFRTQRGATHSDQCFYSIPMVAKGVVIGALGLGRETDRPLEEQELDYLATVAGQAAIAVDNARLFSNLQQKNRELENSYDETIAGWARALDLRDHETEGHSRRVTEMTVELAKAFGSTEAELVQIRRGALLHDIGKMGVPDSVLLKPGPLDEAEWDLMRRHTTHARDMLAPIDFLASAMEIPYSHHEKWDGTGYPLGLAGEEIPLAARIFAIVDVFDALCSDRPYRPAWSRERALEHITSQSGLHFDPKVVEVFLRFMNR